MFDDREWERQHHFFLAVGADVLPLFWVGVNDFGVLVYTVNALPTIAGKFHQGGGDGLLFLHGVNLFYVSRCFLLSLILAAFSAFHFLQFCFCVVFAVGTSAGTGSSLGLLIVYLIM
ncbi:hypothetical protein BCT27_23775 [Enterovibrio norvegicus]|nr:hypothetical protein BCT27_23775 [Enterovibrio norvegicus]